MGRKTLVLFLFLQLALAAGAQSNSDSQAIRVEGTELAKLQDVMDILRMLPGISLEDGRITVTGRGTPAIYINKRKVSDFSELMHITADRVKEIEILKFPGAEYDKDVASVIIIRLKTDQNEGFSLDNTLRLDLTHKISKNDELSLGWRRRSLTLGAAFILAIVATLAACGSSGVAGGSLLLIPMSCALVGVDVDIAMQAVGVGFIIGVIQDSVETALNSSGDAIFTAAVLIGEEKRKKKI